MIFSDALPSASTELPLQQSPEFARTLQALGRDARFRTLRDGTSRIGHLVTVRLPLLGLTMASRGPVWAAHTCFATRRAGTLALRHRGLGLVNAPEGGAGLMAMAGYSQIMTGATLAQMALGPDWRRRCHGKWRNRLTQAEALAQERKVTLDAHPFDPERDMWLLERAARQARARRYKDFPPGFTRAYGAANPGQAQMFVADQGGAPIAGVLVLRHGPVATYSLGWSGQAGRDAEAHRLLMARACDWLWERGHSRWDLGTICTETAPGLARFKLGMGASALRLSGTWVKRPRLGGQYLARAAGIGDLGLIS